MPVTLEVKDLHLRLQEAEEALSAIRSGEVDALVISGIEGEQIYTLHGADYQYRMLIEEMNEGAVIIDALGTITYCNKRFAEMLRAPLEKVIGSSFFEFVSQSRREAFSRLLEHSKSDSSRSEFVLLAISGVQVPVYLAFSAAQTVGPGSTYMVATDLTEQKRNNDIVADEQLARLILDQVAEAVVVCDREGQVIRASQAAQRLAGQEARWNYFDELFALTLSAGDEPVRFANHEEVSDKQGNLSLKSIAAQQDPGNCEVSFHRSDGKVFTLLLNASPLLDPTLSVIGYVITLTDITERKYGEKQLKRANIELEQRAQALTGSNAELQQFAYVASHDLQEPLRTITSYSQLIQKRYGGQLDEKADRYLNFVADAAIRMQQLIEDLLNYSRVSTEARPLQRTDCTQLLAQVLDNLAASITQSNASVTWEPLPTLQAEPSQLVELFQNLISNGIKFHGTEPQRVHINAVRQGDEWLFCVRDNGIGIDPQYSERIFVIFQRLHTREQYRGTGIGLAICKRIIERHNGRIWLESQPGKGTAFFLYTPGYSITYDITTLYLRPPDHTDPPTAVVEVLLIEDSPPDAEIVIEMLADEVGAGAAHFTHVPRLGAALELLDKRLFHIVLADLSLPDAYGLDVVTRLQSAAPSLPIVVLSGGADISSAVQAVHAGAQDYLVKGRLDGNGLLRAIRYAIERKRIADQLQQVLETLEQRVEQRTAQLSAANEQLRRQVAERRRAEDALRIGEAKYRELTELASDAIFIADRSGHFTETNERASELLGYSRVELLGLGLSDVIDPDDLARTPLYIHDMLSGGTVLSERLMRRKDGTGVQTESSAKMLPDGRIQAIVRDVTERLKLEEERRSRISAEQAYEAKSEFLARMSHELRTPLNAILGFGQLLETGDLSPDQQEGVEVIMQAGRHLLALVDEVLDITRLDKGGIALNEEIVPVQELLLASLAATAAISAQNGIHMHTDLVGISDIAVLVDRVSLSKVLTNLLTNAVKYNMRGGSVLVRAVRPHGENELCIKIIDSGQGIAADKIGRLFMPFERLDGETGNVKGTGLGLVLAKLLIQEMRGSIGVESDLGRGSTFWIRLPVASDRGKPTL